MIAVVWLWLGRGGYRGAVLGLLLAVGWDTSRQTAFGETLHPSLSLTFRTVVWCGVGGAAAGLVLAALIWALTESSRAVRGTLADRERR